MMNQQEVILRGAPGKPDVLKVGVVMRNDLGGITVSGWSLSGEGSYTVDELREIYQTHTTK